MARRLKNNLSKRRTRKNTLRRKRIKKYTRGGKPWRSPYMSKKTQEQQGAELREELREEHATGMKVAQEQATTPYIIEIEGLRRERDSLIRKLEILIEQITVLSQREMSGSGFIKELKKIIANNPI